MEPVMKVTIRQEERHGGGPTVHEVNFESNSFDAVTLEELYNLMKAFTIAISYSETAWDDFIYMMAEEIGEFK